MGQGNETLEAAAPHAATVPESLHVPTESKVGGYNDPATGRWAKGNKGRPPRPAPVAAGGTDINGDDVEGDVTLDELRMLLRKAVRRLMKKATPSALSALSQCLSQLERLSPPAASAGNATFIIESAIPRPPDDQAGPMPTTPPTVGQPVPDGAVVGPFVANQASAPQDANVRQPVAAASPAADPYTSREDLLATMTADHGQAGDNEIPAAAWRPWRDGSLADAVGDHGPGLLGGVDDDL